MDTHAYWQSPTWPPGHDWEPDSWSIPNTSMVNDRAGGTIAVAARQRVRGKPHNVSEYQHPSPNSYAAEGPLLSAAYASLQDWDGLWFFDYATDENQFVTGFTNHGAHPCRMVNNILAAALFRRGDVKVAQEEFTFSLSAEKEVDVAASKGMPRSIADGAVLGVPATLSLRSRLDLSIGSDAAGASPIINQNPGAVVVSDTAELRWDNSRADRGVVTIDTVRTKAVVGFVDGRDWNLGGVQIKPGATRHDWCTIGITLIEGTSFDSPAAGKAVLVATGDSENTGQKWTDATHTSVGTGWGTSPTLVEVVPATVILPVSAARVTAWALDERGQRTSSLQVRANGGNAELSLGANGVTLWYEVSIGSAPSGGGDPPSKPTAVNSSGSSGGGAPGLWYLAALGGALLSRYCIRRQRRGWILCGAGSSLIKSLSERSGKKQTT